MNAIGGVEYGGRKDYYSVNYSPEGGEVMKQTIWTIILAAGLAVWAAFIGVSLLGVGPSTLSTSVYALYLMAALAVVAWMQTRWGALLVTVVGLLIFLSEIISAALFLNPQFGDQTVQILYASVTVILPLLGFLSYWSIKE